MIFCFFIVLVSFFTPPFKVVSEVLFPGADSPPVQTRTPRSSRINALPAPSRSPVPPPKHSSQPSEVVGQLMQEAQGRKL